MRVLFIVLMILAFVVTAGLGVMIGQKNLLSEDAKTLTTMVEAAKSLGTQQEKLDELVAMADGVKMSGIASFVLAALALVAVIVGFMKKGGVALAVFGIAVIASIAFIFLSPAFETGPTGGADPRTQSMIVGIGCMATALFGYLAELMRAKKAAKAGAPVIA